MENSSQLQSPKEGGKKTPKLSKPSERSERGFGSSERLTYVAGCLWTPTCLDQSVSNLQGLLGAIVRVTSAQKKFPKFKLLKSLKFYFLPHRINLIIKFKLNLVQKNFAQPCMSGASADNLRGFEDCRKLYILNIYFATHLLNWGVVVEPTSQAK